MQTRLLCSDSKIRRIVQANNKGTLVSVEQPSTVVAKQSFKHRKTTTQQSLKFYTATP